MGSSLIHIHPVGYFSSLALSLTNQPTKHLWPSSDSLKKLRFPLFIFGIQCIPQVMHPENNLPKTYRSCFIKGAAHRVQNYFGRLLDFLNQSGPMKPKHLNWSKALASEIMFPHLLLLEVTKISYMLIIPSSRNAMEPFKTCFISLK